MNGAMPLTRLSHSVPGSPIDDRLNSTEVIGSAESLVGRVIYLNYLLGGNTRIFKRLNFEG